MKIRNYSLVDMLQCWASDKRDSGLKHKRKTNRRSDDTIGICIDRLIDDCDWPNCNSYCPNLQGFFSDQVISPLQYFVNFNALNLNDLADELKMSKQALLKTDYNTIMKMIMSQTLK